MTNMKFLSLIVQKSLPRSGLCRLQKSKGPEHDCRFTDLDTLSSTERALLVEYAYQL